MINDFLNILSDYSMLKIVIIALVVGILVSLCASLLGVSLVLKKYSMIGDGLSHVGYGALAIASALRLSGEYKLEICIPIVVGAAFLLLAFSQNSKINSDAAVAVISTGAIAVGTLIFNFSGGTAGDACNSLFGSASLVTVNFKDMVISIVLSAIVIALFVLFYNSIFAVTFDENFAKAIGVKVKLYNILLSLLTAITIVIGMQIMGAILVSGLIVFPALGGMGICKSFKGVTLSAAVISVISFIIGFFIACIMGIQIGPTVISVNIIAYIIMRVLGKIKKA